MERLIAVRLDGRMTYEPSFESDPLVLVLGGTGKTGRRVVDRLRDLGVRTQIGSRTARPSFDWDDPATWSDALACVSRVYVAYQPDIAVPGAPETIERFAQTAVHEGVQRLVLLSGRGEREAERAEQAVQHAGVDWTILRCSWFAQNFSEGQFVEPIAMGELALPVGDVPEPFVDIDDVADVAVAALTGGGHTGQVYELTGPAALTFADAVEVIASTTGREMTYRTITPEEFTLAMHDIDLPGEDLEFLLYLFSEVLDGRNTPTGDGVQRALGRPPQDFVSFAAKSAASGVWGAR
jgi:uncharacterized protein YbjT (DUF2867 family)